MEEFEFENCDFSDTLLHIETFPDDCLDFNYDSNSSLHEAGNSTNSSSSVKVRTLSISSPVLATKSPFFYKLFKNGMKESIEKKFILRISVSEESGLMDVLNFMYYHKLRATTIPELLQVLIVADKFEVICCMRYCCELLSKVPMSLESAIECLNLPATISMNQSVQPLINAANKYKSELYSLQKNAISLPRAHVEILLASDELRLESEDMVVYFIHGWSSSHSRNYVEFHYTVNYLCVRFLRFHHLSFRVLKQILACHHFDILHDKVREMLLYKATMPFFQAAQPPRIYELRPLNLMDFHSSKPHCVVHLDLDKEECAGLVPGENIASEFFSLAVGEAKASFCFFVRCRKDKQGSTKLGLHLGILDECTRAFYSVEYELAVMKSLISSECKVLSSSWSEACEIEWSELFAEGAPYFAYGRRIRFRAEVQLKQRFPAVTPNPIALSIFF